MSTRKTNGPSHLHTIYLTPSFVSSARTDPIPGEPAAMQ